MPILKTARLTCRPITSADWPFFLALQQDPDVMRHVADARSERDIREAFDSRLPTWCPGDSHWLCLLLCDTKATSRSG